MILQDKTPDIIRRREQTGRVKFTPSPDELENDLRAVFGKYGGSMPVYRFVCDQAEGGIMSNKCAEGVCQVMRGVWSGKGLLDVKAPSAKEVANSVPAEAVGELDMSLPNDVDPEKCMVFDEKAGDHMPGAASNVRTAICASFPEIAKQVVVDAFAESGSSRLVVAVKGGVPDGLKLKLSNFLAEYGCSNPEETFSADGDWIGMFDFTPNRADRVLHESIDDPVSVVVKVYGESDKECWLGCSRKMQDLSVFDGGEVTRVFATNRYSNGMDLVSAGKCLVEGAEIVLRGSRFKVKRAYARNGRMIAESRRVFESDEVICDFPSDLLERLNGPCGLSRRDEEMFRSWNIRKGMARSYEVLGESRWCDEPAFGEPCECTRVLLRM